ncbi:hypothetical protein [uncultured Helicobacter sp.]|uniref:hypothetical protein n=1 Tax=uncultured Helicobacter sp. TaxID=175537 RepID=UPI001C3BCBA7|nr:hypothetical protein [Candidatus Helicobacter avicola]
MKKKILFAIIGVGVLITIGLFVATKIFSAQMGKALEGELNSFLQSQESQDMHIEFEPFVCEGSAKIVCKSPGLSIIKHAITQDSQHSHTKTESLTELVRFSNLALTFGGNKTKALIDIESDISIQDKQLHTKCEHELTFINPLLDLNVQCNTQIGDMESVQVAYLNLAHPSFQSSNLHKIIKTFKDSQQRNQLLENLEFALISYRSDLKSQSLKQSISAFTKLPEKDMQFISTAFAIMESGLRQAQNEETKELENDLANAFQIISDVYIDDTIQEVWYEITPKDSQNPKKFFVLQNVLNLSLADIAANFTLHSGKR